MKEDGQIVGMGNVVPNFVEVVCEIRIANPEIIKEFIEKEIIGLSERHGVTISDLKYKFYLGSMLTPKTDLLEFEESVGLVLGEVVYSDISAGGYFEVQMLQEAWGSKCVVFGAGPANLSHMANEYMEISSLKKAEKCIKEFILKKIS